MDKTIFECTVQEFNEKSIHDMIEWLSNLASEQPCQAGEIFFSLNQSGDHWDGYGEAELTIYREETPEEKGDRKKREAEVSAARNAEREAKERADYEALKAKFG